MKVKIVNPVQHDTRSLSPEDVVNLPDAAAKILIECGSAVLAGRAGSGGGGSEPPPENEAPPENEPAPENETPAATGG